MSVAVVIETELEASALVGWAWQVALARGVDLRVLYAGGTDAQDDSPPVVAARAAVSEAADRHARFVAAQLEQASANDPGKANGKPAEGERLPALEVDVITEQDPADAVLKAVAEHGLKLLVVAKHKTAKSDDALPARLFREAKCAVLLLRPGASGGQRSGRILVPTAGGPHATEALKLADALTELPEASCGIDQQGPGGVDALYVEPNIGPEAQQVGERILDKAVRKALGDPAGHPQVRQVVHIASDFRRGIAEVVEGDATSGGSGSGGGYDLVLLGATNHWHARKALFGSVPEKLLQDPQSELAVGVVRQQVPWMDAATEALRAKLQRVVPQLERADRIELVERVQHASAWNFDFVALICLSTLIATLGLMQNSAAVVIGAMLVAPLMTPLIACGMSVVQGNGRLVREASRSVLLGFLLALAIAAAMGFVIGELFPQTGLTPQMMARGRPNVLDLGVAFVSGLAAAYATARPNLSGALPGVAIAAALVPPISTSGVALAQGDYVTSAGASLLFLTNIVAIVLGAAIALYAVGMQAAHLHTRKKRWARHAAMSLTLAAVLLGVPLCYWLYASLPKHQIPDDLRERITQRVELHAGCTFESIAPAGVKNDELHIELVVQCPAAVDQSLADDIDAMLEGHFGRACRVRVVTHLVTESGD